jgi:raffinose/stachyose/melibiose transport system substrate-binding protein
VKTAAVAICIAPSLVACGGGDSESDGNTVRFLGHTGLEPSMKVVIEEFEKEHPDIDIKATYAPAGPTFGQTLVTQVQGGNAPDVFYTNGGTGATESLVPLAESGKLMDLSDESWVDSIPEAATDMYTVDDKVYGLLMDEAPHGLLYKPASLDELGLEAPKTFDDVLNVCKVARDNDKYGIALSGQSAGFATEIIAADTVFAQDPEWNAKRANDETTFADTPGWTEAIDRLVQLDEAECFQPGAETASTPQSFEPMISGQTLMTIVPSGALGAVAEGKPEDWAMSPFPGETDADTRVPVGYQDGLAVSAETESKDAALTFLEFVANEGAATRAELSGTVSLAQAAEGDFPSSLSAFAPYYENEQTIARPHDTWAGGGALNALNVAVVAVMTGQQSADEALATVDQAWGR